MGERRGVTFERLNRMEREYADDDDVLDVIAAVKHLAATSLQRQVEDLQRQLAEATGQAEAAKQATREIMGERNTWARQLADMRDERNTARDEANTQRDRYISTIVDRDNLCVEIERVIEEWERHPDRSGNDLNLSAATTLLRVKTLRRALAPWLTT
jgi:chromosome segregation ATPase